MKLQTLCGEKKTWKEKEEKNKYKTTTRIAATIDITKLDKCITNKL